MPPLKRRRLVRLGTTGSSVGVHTEEPIFWITKIVEPSSSDAISSDHSSCDRGAVLALSAAPSLVEGDDKTAYASPARVTMFEDHALENPQSDVSSPRLEEAEADVTYSCFYVPLEPFH